jgi:hypothetical protein
MTAASDNPSNNVSLMEQQRGEQILASACRFLDEGGEGDLAELLASGALAALERTEEDILFAGLERRLLDLHLIAPRQLYVVLGADPQWDETAATLWGAIEAVIPPGYFLGRTYVRAALIDPPEDWRREYGATRPRADVSQPPELGG